MTNNLESHIGPTVTLYPTYRTPQVSREVDFLRIVQSHTDDSVVHCNAQLLFLRRAAAEIESVIDKKSEQQLSRQDIADIALLEMQAMTYRVKSRIVAQDCRPQAVAGELIDVFKLPSKTS